MNDQPPITNPMNVTVDEWPWRFRVPSRSKPKYTRLVDWQFQRCDCPAGACRKPCRHLRAVNDYALFAWKRIIARMTTSAAGMKLLRDMEAFVTPTKPKP
jgi:hypothetical protein